MKKSFSFLVAIIVILIFVTPLLGCSNKSDPNSSKIELDTNVVDLNGATVSIVADWKWDDMKKPGVNEGWDRWQARIVEAEKRNNCKIELKTISYANKAQSLTAKMLAGDAPGDIMWVSSTYFYTWILGNLLEDLRQYKAIDFNNTDVWLNNSIAGSSIGDKTYAIWSSEPTFTSMIAFNKKTFKDKGLENPYYYVEKNEWTIDKLKELADKTTEDMDKNGKPEKWGFAGYNEANLVADMVNLYGGKIFDIVDGKYKFVLDSEKAMQGLNAFADLGKSSSIYKSPEGAAYDTSLKDFEAGNIAMFEVSYWMLSLLAKVDNFDYGITYFPKKDPKDEYISTTAFWNGWGIPKSSKLDKKGVAQILNQVWGDHDLTKEKREEAMIATLESQTKDKESINYILDVFKNNRVKYILDGEPLGCHWNIKEPTCLFPDAYMAIAGGVSTPAQVVSAKKDAIQAYLDETYNTKPELQSTN